MKIKVAQALSEFMSHLISRFGKPINVSTISAFAKMLGEIVGAMEDENG